MNKQEIMNRLLNLRQELLSLYKEKSEIMDESGRLSINEILMTLGKVYKEFSEDSFTPRSERYGYIARLVVEMDPDVMPEDLGGELIDIENIYRNF
jgi:hypothetical protein